MKRNWDTLRRILIALEAIPDAGGQLESDAVAGLDNETAFYHMRLLIEAGLAVGSCPEQLGRTHGCLFRLTWAGHELLDAIRRDTVWHRVKEAARTKSIDLTLDVIRLLAAQAVRALLGAGGE